MGYSTYFEGTVHITPEPKATEIAFIKEYFDETDDRCDFEFTKDMCGLQHNGAEKSYEQDEKMQELIDATVEQFPHLKFNGTLKAKGESYDDRWLLKVTDNVVEKVEQVLTGPKVICPHCEEEFVINEEEQAELKG